MKAIVIEAEKAVLRERPLPRIKQDEVLIKIAAAGVNRPDILQRKGLYPPPKGVTDVLGLEVAGEVVRIGKSAKGFKIGQKICALVAGGGYAEYAAVPAVQCLPIPKGLSMEAAATLPETFFTVWTNLQDRALLQKGEILLVHGGSSGIGTAAIQIAKHHFGARVIVTAGIDAKCAACLKLGAWRAINYKTHDFETEVLRLTKGRGVDVVLDMVGGDYVPRNLNLLTTGGRHVSIAMQRGRKTELDIYKVMSKRLVLTGSTLRAQTPEFKGEIAKSLKKYIWPLVSQGKIKPTIDTVFTLNEAEAALDYLEAGGSIGKVVLSVCR